MCAKRVVVLSVCNALKRFRPNRICEERFTCPDVRFVGPADAFADLPLLDSEPVPPRIAAALEAMRAGRAVVLQDDHDRENEADLIVAAERITPETMALLIRECSGIVCLCLTDDTVRALELPPMVQTNESRNGTAFTVSIEAREGVHTGVSAADRVTTIRAAIAEGAKPHDIVRPGHVFPLRAQPGGVLAPRSHRRHGRPVDPRGPEAGRRAVRADESGWHDDARRRGRAFRATARVADADDRGTR